MFDYVKTHYGVPADIGRRVVVNGNSGIIVADRGQYIGVNFDLDRPCEISNCHPTWCVEYQGMGKARKITRSQARYRRYMEICDCFDNFKAFLAYETNERKKRRKDDDHDR